MEESGRTLFPSPLLSTAVLATSALLSVGGSQQVNCWPASQAAT